MLTRLTLIFLLAIAGILVLNGPAAVHSQNARHELTLQEKRGKAFYLRGESVSGQETTALMGEIDVPASTLTCAGCHGLKGQGITEGGVTAGPLTWSHLTKPYGHTDEGGRKHPAFSETSFVRMLTAGLDPAGNKLAVAMPAYRMSQEDMANLIAYLKRIETDTDPGINETSIVLGTVLPEKTALSGLAQSMGDVLQAYFAEINSRGGIYNRKIELRVMNGDSKTTVANTKRLIDEEQVFAIVSGLSAGAEDGVAALTQEKEVPFIGPSTLMPQRGAPVNRYVFYLLPGLKEQARALATLAARKTWRKRCGSSPSPLPAPGQLPMLRPRSLLRHRRRRSGSGRGWSAECSPSSSLLLLPVAPSRRPPLRSQRRRPWPRRRSPFRPWRP